MRFVVVGVGVVRIPYPDAQHRLQMYNQSGT